MATTTIRIDEKLKKRLTGAADRAGKTAHAFILDAIARRMDEPEADDAFHRLADERWAAILATGKSVSWEDASAYLAAPVRGEKARRPAARKARR